jgi:outer membrane murein-binding lipoprotein Lpp
MPDDEQDGGQEQDVGAKIDALSAKIDGLEARLARQSMTPGQRAAEARAAMRRGYEQAAQEREEQGGEAA